MSQILAEIGEIEILNRLKKYMDIGQIDDDTALIQIINENLLINTDVLVEDVHFNTKTATSEDIGWKAVASNLADLASSGADNKIQITVGLVVPPNTEWKWVQGLYEGMYQALNQFNGKLIGGDCSKGNQKMISITAIGKLGPLRLHRSHAQPGDCLVTSGPHGLSRLGLSLLLSENLDDLEKIPESLQSIAINKHRRPNPPIQSLRELQKCKPPNLPWRAAGTDSSDGLLEAINGLCRSSDCQAVLKKEHLPRHPNWPSGKKWDKWCLIGGEDYELVLSLPEGWANKFITKVPLAQKIGVIRNGSPNVFWENGLEINQDLTPFKHF